jgi:hypothetical protein
MTPSEAREAKEISFIGNVHEFAQNEIHQYVKKNCLQVFLSEKKST